MKRVLWCLLAGLGLFLPVANAHARDCCKPARCKKVKVTCCKPHRTCCPQSAPVSGQPANATDANNAAPAPAPPSSAADAKKPYEEPAAPAPPAEEGAKKKAEAAAK